MISAQFKQSKNKLTLQKDGSKTAIKYCAICCHYPLCDEFHLDRDCKTHHDGINKGFLYKDNCLMQAKASDCKYENFEAHLENPQLKQTVKSNKKSRIR